jgi:nucleoside-diphosphate-sugar epimerase
MKAYITGGSGFVGSHLAKRLSGDVVAIPHRDIQTTKIDPFDYFFFCSSYGNLYNQKEDEQIFQANVLDLAAILFLIKDMRFKSFVYLSTSSVKLRTQTMYSRMKKAAEEVLLAFMEKHDIPICIIRPFSVTGVGEQQEHLMPTLINAAMTGKPVNLVPNATHDFIDVADVVEGMVTLSQRSARGIFELGTGKMYTNLEVMDLVEKVTKKEINVNFVESMRSYDSDSWVSTNFKARGFGWLPRKSLEDSIKEMYAAQ